MSRVFWFLILGLVLITACTARPAQPAPVQPVILPTLAPAATQTAVPTAAAVKPTKSAPASIPVTGVEALPSQPEGVVSVSGLNLRMGPGLNYRTRGVLLEGTRVRLEGRSQDGNWVVARLQNGDAGWVYGVYLKTTADLAALPMLEASGGPVVTEPQPTPAGQPQPAQPKNYRLSMSIDNSQALVSVARFPADREITIRLSTADGTHSMVVANGSTDASGAAELSFEMPGYWPDGSAITESGLRLTAGTADGSFERSIKITYFTAQ